MTFTYQPSAAGISWTALCQALDSQAQRQKDLLGLYKDNCKVAIQETQVNATEAYNELNMQAQGECMQGIMGLVGATVGTATAIGSYGMESYNLRNASNAESTTTNQIGVSQKNTPDTASDELEMQEMGTGSAEVEGNNSASSTNTNNNNASESNTASKTPTTNREGDQYRSKAQWWQQQSSNFTGFGNQVGTSIGSIMDSTYKTQAADAKRKEVLAQGIAQVMTAQGQMLTSGVDGTNNQMNNTESTITTIIQVSAVRG